MSEKIYPSGLSEAVMLEKDEVLSPAQIPKIYVYTIPEYENREWQDKKGFGVLKVGYTTEANVENRISAQLISTPEQQWKLLLVDIAIGPDGAFKDHRVHSVLEKMGQRRLKDGKGKLTEWFECTIEDVRAALNEIKTGVASNPNRLESFELRPEQQAAIEITASYFKKYSKEVEGQAPHFLWNAKMRFGKTFTTYQLARRMKWTRILVLTFKPAVQDSWKTDLETHVDFAEWQFLGRGDSFDLVDETKPYVWFASFQDVLGKQADGSIKKRLEAMHLTDWDCVILDEYHFGAWREAAKDIYDSEPEELRAVDEFHEGFDEEVLESRLSLNINNYLYLSGTPFRALANGEFSEDQIFSWTYSDEQRAKRSWDKANGKNPYESLPTMAVLTYQLPPDIRRIAQETDHDEFDLNEFFAADQIKEDGKTSFRFKHELHVQKWLNLLRGQHLPFDERQTSSDYVRPPIPFEDKRLLSTLKHTFWFLPSVAACKAMGVLLKEPQNVFFHDYRIVVSAGSKAGIGLDALPPVRDAISRTGVETRSITLSCGKLTTGVTVPEWSGILMLRNLSSPETYFQAAFRVQSPWTIREIDPIEGQTEHVLKPTCYLFDFSPNRALNLISEYAVQLDTDVEGTKEKKVAEFLRYLPVLCYDGYSMQELKADDLLDFVVAGTGSTMLARRWQSYRLIDVSTPTLARLLRHEELVQRLEEFESFRNLAKDLTRTISAEKNLKKLKTKSKPTETDKKTISDDEKALKSFRKRLQENLIKFATRIPVFMYLTDHREETLKDVIEIFEPDLFKRVTNLNVEDFKLLCEIGVFNATTMDSAIFAFRRFEDASLSYAGGGIKNQIFGGFIDSYATRDDVIRQT
jgi:hypothetical protein